MRKKSSELNPRVKLTFREVNVERWPDLVRLFEARGGPKNCWCMVWRAQGREARSTRSAERKRSLKLRVVQAVPIGILAYADEEPVAWCSIAPRDSYRAHSLLGHALDANEASEKVWSLVCFFVQRSWRGVGVLTQLIEAAAKTAKRHGARVIEAYPVDDDSPSYRFMGRVSVLADAGFHEVARAGSRRHVMRRNLSSLRSRRTSR